jgi:chemotaxis signal transduction protein
MTPAHDLEALDLIFRLGGERLSVPVRQVREVAPFRPETVVPVPRAPDFVGGVVSHHGRIVTLIDLGRFLKTRTEARGTPTHLLLLARDDVSLGIVCEGVERIEAPRAEGDEASPSAGEAPRRVDLDAALAHVETFFG